jgi:hypothetical protein
MISYCVALAIASLLIGNKTAFGGDNDQRPQSRFAGEWSNEDSETRSLTKLIIRKNGDERLIRAWGACDPTDCNWGETRLFLLGESVDAQDLPYAFATWNHEGMITHIVLRFDVATLVAETYCIYTDHSQRANYRRIERLKKSYLLRSGDPSKPVHASGDLPAGK